MSAPDWITGIPVAHRGLHNREKGCIENTVSAFEAALAHGFIIETDLQYTGEDDPVVFHDPTLDRLTESSGPLAELTTAQFKQIRYSASSDEMLDFSEFLELISGRVPLLIEIKSKGELNAAYARRISRILRDYKGEFAVMSFDPRMVLAMREALPGAPRGLIASGFERADWPAMPAMTRFKLRHLLYAWHTAPDYIAYSINALPAPAPLFLRALGKPLLSWTVNTPERLAKARRYADNIIFEDLPPEIAKQFNSVA